MAQRGRSGGGGRSCGMLFDSLAVRVPPPAEPHTPRRSSWIVAHRGTALPPPTPQRSAAHPTATAARVLTSLARTWSSPHDTLRVVARRPVAPPRRRQRRHVRGRAGASAAQTVRRICRGRPGATPHSAGREGIVLCTISLVALSRDSAVLTLLPSALCIGVPTAD